VPRMQTPNHNRLREGRGQVRAREENISRWGIRPLAENRFSTLHTQSS
jgi:hypothetical protein